MADLQIPINAQQMAELQKRIGDAIQNDDLVFRFASLLKGYGATARPLKDLEDKAFFDVMLAAVLVAPELAKLTVGLTK